MPLEALSPKVLDLIAADAPLEQLGTGMVFTEGPVWNAHGQFLVFSDIPADRIKRWSPDDGVTDYRVPSGKSNGLTYDRQGRLLACEGAKRRVTRTEADGSVVAIASHYQGKKLNSPNDMVIKSDGSIYFTDPPYALNEVFGAPGEREQSCNGVYRLSPDGQNLTLLVDDFEGPNGLCFSPDESRLYIDDSARLHLRVFEV